MTHLLNLLAAIALLVWGTHLVRTGILRVFGASLRNVLAKSTSNRFAASLSGIGVTALVQSSTATALIVAAFVGQGLMTLPSALAVMLGADIGTSLMAVVFSRDLSWLSPLFILAGVVMFLLRQSTTFGRIGRVLIGLGLMLLALRLVTQSANILTQAPVVKSLLAALTSDLLLEVFVGAVLTVLSYSSLAIVLLTATLAHSHVVPIDVAIGLVLGANLGSGLLAVLTTLRAKVETRQVPLGNLVFKVVGIAIAIPFIAVYLRYIPKVVGDLATQVVLPATGIAFFGRGQQFFNPACNHLRPADKHQAHQQIEGQVKHHDHRSRIAQIRADMAQPQANKRCRHDNAESLEQQISQRHLSYFNRRARRGDHGQQAAAQVGAQHQAQGDIAWNHVGADQRGC